MPLPILAHGRLAVWNLRLRGIVFLATCGLLVPHLSHATHYTVDPAGGGDFTTLQGALNAHVTVPRDSILVMPGAYSEVVDFSQEQRSVVVVGLAGPGATTLHGVTVVPPNSAGLDWWIRGFTFDRPQALGPGRTSFLFEGCEFLAEVQVQGDCSRPNFFRCTFHARTRLLGYENDGAFEELHFVGAPLVVAADACGPVTLQGCTFVGPADTLVTAIPISEENGLHFSGCDFRGAARGIVVASKCNVGVSLGACVFADLAADAVRMVDSLAYGLHCEPTRLYVTDSRFERCGTAVRWTPGASTSVGMLRDTVLDCTGDGIVVSPGSAGGQVPFLGLRVLHSGGHGLVVERRYYRGTAGFEDGFALGECQFEDNHGDGMRVSDALAPNFVFPSSVSRSTSLRNGGAGFRLEGGRWLVADNVAWRNGAEGLVFRTKYLSSAADSVIRNTCSENGGDGLVADHAAAASAPPQVVQRNLVVANVGRGLVTTAPHFGSVAYNDAWHNIGADFWNVSAPLDSNLTVDPRFCDLPAGDLSLAFGSPCGVGGTYGAVGARPEACGQPAGAGTTAPALAFSAWPNPARGAVEFAVPAGAPGRIDVVDVAGRVVWSRVVRSGERVRWTGETGGGRARPGLYWARLVVQGERRGVRLAWIE